MPTVKENLAALALKRAKAKERRSNILETILAISEERKNAMPASAGTSDMSGMQRAAGRAVAASTGKGAVAGPHSMGDGHGHKSQATVNGLNAQFHANLQRLMKDAPGKITIGSGYRSYEQQAKLYQRWVNRVPGQAPAAKPGKSNHNHGTAADLVYANKATSNWVHQNAERYGLFFPMSYEPWHIEPVSNKSQYKKYRKK